MICKIITSILFRTKLADPKTVLQSLVFDTLKNLFIFPNNYS